VRGVYAVAVSGRLPSDVIQEITRDAGKKYTPRN